MSVKTPNAPLTEDQILAANIGKPVVLNSPIELSPYDPEWPSRYAALEARIRTALGTQILLLEHVGSTSVPGLPAKPVIDIVLAVARSSDEPSYVPALERAGFELRIREPDWFEHRLLKSPPPTSIFTCSHTAAKKSTACLRFAIGCG